MSSAIPQSIIQTLVMTVQCRNNPENFSFYKGKCMSDKRIERLKERRAERAEIERRG